MSGEAGATGAAGSALEEGRKEGGCLTVSWRRGRRRTRRAWRRGDRAMGDKPEHLADKMEGLEGEGWTTESGNHGRSQRK